MACVRNRFEHLLAFAAQVENEHTDYTFLWLDTLRCVGPPLNRPDVGWSTVENGDLAECLHRNV